VPWIPAAWTVQVNTEDLDSVMRPSGPQMVRARLYLPQGRANARRWYSFTGASSGHRRAQADGVCDGDGKLRHAGADAELPHQGYHVSEESVRTIGESAKWYAARTGGPVRDGLSFSACWRWCGGDPLHHADFKFVFCGGSQTRCARDHYLSNHDVRPTDGGGAAGA